MIAFLVLSCSTEPLNTYGSESALLGKSDNTKEKVIQLKQTGDPQDLVSYLESLTLDFVSKGKNTSKHQLKWSGNFQDEYVPIRVRKIDSSLYGGHIWRKGTEGWINNYPLERGESYFLQFKNGGLYDIWIKITIPIK